MPQLADVADIFDYRKIGIEAERLCQISRPRARIARLLSENLRHTAAGFHHSSQNLKCRGFACAIGPDQPKDFAALHLKGNSAYGFQGAIFLLQVANINCDRR